MTGRQQIPERFAEHLRALRDSRSKSGQLTALLVQAHAAGWTYSALAEPLGVTRQAVENRIRRFRDEPVEAPVVDVPDPKLSRVVLSKRKQRLVIRVRPDVAEQLKAAADIARTVNGATAVDDPARRISEEFSAALARLRTQGVTYRELTRVTGLTQIALRARLGRHGHQNLPPSMESHRYRNRQTDHAGRKRKADGSFGRPGEDEQ